MPTSPVPKGLIDFIRRYQTIAIAGHLEPDGDCIGSSLALAAFLKRLGKHPILLSQGPFKRTEIAEYAPLFSAKLDDEYKGRGDVGVIVVDCSSTDRTGSLEGEIAGLPLAIIDHHATNTDSSPETFVDATAPAAACLVQDVIEKMTGEVSSEEADFLLFAICTDTGFFRHLDSNSSETFSRVSRLVAKGARPKVIFAKMNGNKSLASRILIGRSLERLTLHYEGRLAVTYQSFQDFREYGLEGRDTDSLYMLMQGIKGVKALVVLKEEADNKCSIGFRSFDTIDVSLVAKKFGGGGHKQASGAYCDGSYESLLPAIIKEFAEQMQKNK